MSRTFTRILAASVLTAGLGAFAAPVASADQAVPITPVWGSVSLCFSVPVGSAALVWCI